MDVGFLHTIITTTRVIFYTKLDSIEYCFYVNAGESKLDKDNNLTIKDYIADRTYFIPCSSVITEIHTRDEVIPQYGKKIDYIVYKTKFKNKIQRNNSILEKEFNEVKTAVDFIDNTEQNLYILKTERPYDIIYSMKNFGIRDLFGFINNTTEVINQIKTKCLLLMNSAAEDAILKLNIERDKFLLESDSDSVEEVDLIIQMIKDEIETTTFESLEKPEDIYSLWPPILLPVPF